MPATIISRNYLQTEYALGPKVVIRNIRKDDFSKLRAMLEQENDESLFVSPEEIEAGWTMCPKGFFVACNAAEEIVSYCGAVILSETQALMSAYYTRKRDRGKGVGQKVFNAAMAAMGKRNVGGNFFEKNDQLSKKMGFTVESFAMTDFIVNINSPVTVQPVAGVTISPASDENFSAVSRYDKRLCPILRSGFLRNMLAKCSEAFVAKKDGQVVGFGCIKSCQDNYRLMPLYADEPEVAVMLWQSLVSTLPLASMVEFALPTNNCHATNFLSAIGLEEKDGDRVTRMYTKSDLQFNTDSVYSIMNFESRLM